MQTWSRCIFEEEYYWKVDFCLCLVQSDRAFLWFSEGWILQILLVTAKVMTETDNQHIDLGVHPNIDEAIPRCKGQWARKAFEEHSRSMNWRFSKFAVALVDSNT